MINGAHCIIVTKDPAADAAFFRDVIGLPCIDVGNGRLFFGLPPAELAFHIGAEGGAHEIYLMCEDIEVFVAAMHGKSIVTEPIADRGWGLVTQVHLPGGSKLGVYQPRHARPPMP